MNKDTDNSVANELVEIARNFTEQRGNKSQQRVTKVTKRDHHETLQRKNNDNGDRPTDHITTTVACSSCLEITLSSFVLS